MTTHTYRTTAHRDATAREFEQFRQGKVLRAARGTQGMTQREVAVKLSISTSTYASYEVGRRSIPSDLVRVLCRVLRVNANTLFGITAIPQDPSQLVQELASEVVNLRRVASDKFAPLCKIRHYRLADVDCVEPSGHGVYDRTHRDVNGLEWDDE